MNRKGAAALRSIDHGGYADAFAHLFDVYSNLRRASQFIAMLMLDATDEQEALLATPISTPHIIVRLEQWDKSRGVDGLIKHGVFSRVVGELSSVERKPLSTILLYLSDTLNDMHNPILVEMVAKARLRPENGGYRDNEECLRDLRSLYALLVTYDTLLTDELARVAPDFVLRHPTHTLGRNLAEIIFSDPENDAIKLSIDIINEAITWIEGKPGQSETADLAEAIANFCDKRLDTTQLEAVRGTRSCFNIRRLIAALNNIANNACDFAATRASISLTYDFPRGEAVVTINDDGSDIPSRLINAWSAECAVPGRPHLFDLDITDRQSLVAPGKPSGRAKGTGLGTWQSWQTIKEEMGGTIR
ncbi:MAG: ATP-binding protein, partial [Candidatus Omnitrophota bacterium]